MSRQEILDKIRYREEKRDWCIREGRMDQAEWNQGQIDNLNQMLLLQDVDDFSGNLD